MARGRFLYSLVIASLLGLLSLEAGATSFVMVSDADLADEATLIAEVRIEASRAAAASGLPATLYNARVLEVLKGEAPGETLTVRVAGGATQQGQALRFWGAPSFATGTQAVLFLVPRRDGSWGVLHWMLGAFYQVELGRRPALLRNLDEATELRRAPGGGFEPVIDSVDLPRDPAAFKGWLAARARGEKAAPSYFLEAGSAEARLAEKFTFILPGDGIPIRWFEFASGGSIGWRADTTGQVGVPGGAFSEFQAALSAWTNDGGSLINYAYRGKTSSRATQCAEPFPEGKIVFDDPSSDIDGSYDCLRGGVLAVGGPCFADGDLQTFNGRSYHPAGDAFVITNDNLDCFFESTGDPSCSARELFTHELGHTLGLGHSADRSATMYAFFHGDGRCNALRSDDRAAVAFLYPGGGGGGGTSVGAPTNLTATVFSASPSRESSASTRPIASSIIAIMPQL
ncbi:MAG TPA: matrixin family metalloprotease, partial [Thermoanaerobaculia bacterium]|nr:matrixin family metalloprotease [Thermoanaerobaculia bacterium]